MVQKVNRATQVAVVLAMVFSVIGGAGGFLIGTRYATMHRDAFCTRYINASLER